MWQKVYNFCSDGYISSKNFCKVSHIYKHKYAYLKPKNLKKKTNFKEEINRKISLPLLQYRVGPMLNSLFWNANSRLSEISYFDISESQKYSKYNHYIYLLALVFKRENLCNWQQLDLQVVAQMLVLFIQRIILKGTSFKSGKIPHTSVICFHYF